MISTQLVRKRAIRIGLAVVIVVCVILLLRPYMIAKYHGHGRKMERSFLPYAQLSGADLSGSDLFLANLRGANLSHSRLRGSRLNGANLEHADLTWANLQEADLRAADLAYANLAHADLSGARLDATCLHTNFTGANMSGVSANQEGFGTWVGCNFSGTNLSNATMRVWMSGSHFDRCNLRGADLAGCEFDPSGYYGETMSSGPLGDEKFGPADLRGAIADKQTDWPEQFDPKKSGVVMLP